MTKYVVTYESLEKGSQKVTTPVAYEDANKTACQLNGAALKAGHTPSYTVQPT